MKISNPISLLVTVIILYSCTTSPVLTELPPSPGSREYTPDILLTTTQTMTPYTFTSTPLITPTTTNLPTSTRSLQTSTTTAQHEIIQYQCSEVLSDLPTDAEVIGVIVISGYGETSKTTLINMETHTRTDISEPEGTSLLFFEVSPNRKWLAYLLYSDDPGKSKLIITTEDGKSEKISTWNDDWYIIEGWLDNENLLISKRPTDITFGTLVILNPFSGEQKELEPKFPDMVEPGIVYLRWGNYSAGGAIYNPSLTQVLYPRTTSDFREIALWDIISHKELAAIPTILASGPAPKWSPDGNRIAIVQTYISNPNRSDLFLLDINGKINQITQFSTFEKDHIGFLDWSPDGRYVAFWLRASPSEFSDDRLVVLDIINGKLINYCIPGSINGDSSTPIWSPDSRQLVVENYLGDNSRKVILVDIVNNFAVQIAEDVSPVGWMVSP